MTDFHVEAVEFDSDLAEWSGVEPGTYYTIDGGETYMDEAEFRTGSTRSRKA